MAKFQEILSASGEQLLKLLYRSNTEVRRSAPNSAREYARKLGLTYAQLVCALGFNSSIQQLPDVLEILGFESYDALAHERNQIFTKDIYDRLGIKDVLAIYLHVPNDMKMLEVMQYLLTKRLVEIEGRIEATVNSIVIERYKKEMRAIYNDGVAQIEFSEQRLNQTHSGFRALLNEVALIAEARLIPIGDLFFRDTILPEEKRRLIMKGLIPRDLIEQRLADSDISARESRVLEDQLNQLDQEI